jgi:dolichol-phosphate mannosyltransferase
MNPSAAGKQPPDLSVVVPLRNEGENVAPLVAEISAALDGVAFELICVDDGSTDDTWDRLRGLMSQYPFLRPFRHRGNHGQSAALWSGVRAARGGWIATLDGDGQNDPADIPRLWAHARGVAVAGDVMICGQRARREDNWAKRRASRIANAVRGAVLGDRTPDTGCGLKVFRRDAFLRLPAFNHMHRFLPALALRNGGHVESMPVNHRPRRAGRSNYGVFDRLWVGMSDLFGVFWLMRRPLNPRLDDEGE